MVLRGHGSKMNRLWLVAIRALMECDTIQAAAARTGISRNTLALWLKDKDFREACRTVQEHRQAALLKELAAAIPAGCEEPAA